MYALTDDANRMLNLRDLGGAPTARGQRVRTGRVYRAGLVMGIADPAARAALAARGIRAVYDFRTDDEHPVPGPDPARGLRVRRLPFSGITPEFRLIARPTYRDYADNYARLLPRAMATVRSVFTLLATTDDMPVAMGCSLGKDRTGIVAAILLASLGVPDEAVAADYAATAEALAGRVLELADYAARLGLTTAELARRCATRAETMYLFLATLRAAYGEVDGYLAAAGVGRDTARCLLDRLVESVPSAARTQQPRGRSGH